MQIFLRISFTTKIKFIHFALDSREVVDDDDLNEYMEYGDEDDDYIDDDVKEVKRKQRKLTKNSGKKFSLLV